MPFISLGGGMIEPAAICHVLQSRPPVTADVLVPSVQVMIR